MIRPLFAKDHFQLRRNAPPPPRWRGLVDEAHGARNVHPFASARSVKLSAAR